VAKQDLSPNIDSGADYWTEDEAVAGAEEEASAAAVVAFQHSYQVDDDKAHAA
jgi:hypothetical protein